MTQATDKTKKITEKNYPITKLWIFKSPLIMLVVSIVALFFGYWFPAYVLVFPYLLIANPLIRKNFHYSIDDDYLTVKQGVISKQERKLPYGVIQNVHLSRDLFDRIFGLSSLTIENAVKDKDQKKFLGIFKRSNQRKAYQQSKQDFVGSKDNQLKIPGLKMADAEALKLALLDRVKKHAAPSQSGL